jgi:5'-3' exoribonuclease 2
MDLIRRQRAQADYDPNTTHVMYGLDADLIMLSLATHEPHFKVLREDVFADDRKRRGGGCHRCGQPGHHSSTCRGEIKPKEGDFDGKTAPPDRKPFIFLDVAVLREYLEIELDIPNMGFPFDLERAIDDWVFMIFFVGNDFLPHLPSLDIREGAVDTLLRIWRDSLPKMRGYLTEHGNVNLERAQHILDGLAAREDDIFRKRREGAYRAARFSWR